MKILYVTAKFPNIIQPWLLDLITHVKKIGHSVMVVTLQQGDESLKSTLSERDLIECVVHVKVGKGDFIKALLGNYLSSNLFRSIRGLINCKYVSLRLIKKLYRCLMLSPYMCDMGVDVIHSHSEPAGYMLLPVIRSQDKPLVITFHGLPPSGVIPLKVNERKEYTEAASIVLVNTQYAKKQYIHLGCKEHKIKIIPQGIDLDKFCFKPLEAPKKGDTIKILSVGRLCEEKGYHYVLRAIKEIIDKGYIVSYTVIGGGPFKEELISLAFKLNISECITFVGNVIGDDIVEYYHNAHIFVQASVESGFDRWGETQGVVIQEAQACGLIVVATNVGGIPECVNDNSDAFLVGDRSYQQIADKIEWLLVNSDKWSGWRSAARNNVEENYDITYISKKVASLYRSLQ